MAPDLHNTSLVQRIIDMGLYLAVDGDAAVGEDGLGLVAADAVQAVHDKVEQFVGLLDLADNGFVVVARYSVVVAAWHFFELTVKS